MKRILLMAAVCLMAAMAFAAQCAAITKKGTQCKRQASPGSEFCWQHGGTTKAQRAAGADAAPVQTHRAPKRSESVGEVAAPVSEGRCQATTKAGAQCKRRAQPGGIYCAQHAAMQGEGDASAAQSPAKPTRRNVEPSNAAPPVQATEPANGMCQGKTKNGEPCKRKAKPGSKFCWQHEE